MLLRKFYEMRDNCFQTETNVKKSSMSKSVLHDQSSSNRNEILLICLVLTVLCLAVFGQVRNFDFVNYDDPIYVAQNSHISNGLSYDSIIWAFTTPNGGNWLPLTWLSLMLDCQLFGTDAGRIHLVNVFFHLANTLLLFVIFRKITTSVWPSAFVAAAFALHPMHVESVAWITERKDVLSTFFFLLTLAAYIGYVRHRGYFRYLLTMVLFIFGLLAKPMIITLPFVLLLLDYWPLNRFSSPKANPKLNRSAPQNLNQILIEKIPFFAISGISSLITFLVHRNFGDFFDLTEIPLGSRIANSVLSYAIYIGKLFWPQKHAVFYPYNVSDYPFWQIALCVFLLVAVSIFVICLYRTQKYLLVGWLWFLGTLIPVIGIIQSGEQAYADRYTYIPYIGLFIMITWGIAELSANWPYQKIILGGLMLIILGGMRIASYRQVSYWKNSFTLFSHVLDVNPNNKLAHNQLGVYLVDKGKLDEAVLHYKVAIKIDNNYSDAYNNLCVAYNRIGNFDKSLEYGQEAVRTAPNEPTSHFNLGIAFYQKGIFDQAVQHWRETVRLNPKHERALSNLGAILYQMGNTQEAENYLKEAFRLNPKDPAVKKNLMQILSDKNKCNTR
jgi:protein O-mannosyl-transferase